MSLIKKRNDLAADMHAMHNTAKAGERAFTVDERAKWDAMKVALEGFDEQIKLEKESRSIVLLDDEPGFVIPKTVTDARTESRDAYDEVFGKFMRSGKSGLSYDALKELEKRALSTTAAAGGYTIPQGFGGKVIEAMKQYSGVEAISTVLLTDSGNTIPFATNDDTANVGELLAENAAAAEQDTTFGTVSLDAYMYSSKMIRISLQLLQDSDVDLENYIAAMLGRRLGRIQAQHAATGTGTGQPNGIITATSTGFTAASATAITLSALTALEHSVDPAYRNNGMAKFVFNDATFKAIKDLQDSTGAPLWRPSVAESIPSTINGYQYAIDVNYPSMAVNAKVMTFGDHSEYTIRRVSGVGIKRLEERYAEYAQVAFLGFNRMDADLLNTSAVKHLKMAAA